MEYKKKILWCSEASILFSGFSKLSGEILKRLYNTGRFELFEQGSYARSDDPKAGSIPWDFYGAIPMPDNRLGVERYNSSVYGQFGEAVFEQTLLATTPDIVIANTDQWMCEYHLRSPYRPNFKWLIWPTVDGSPQKIEWLDTYSKADKLLTYSRYGKETLEKESGGTLNVEGIVAPGVDHEVYKPLDKAQVRKDLGIKPQWKILTTIMRNQKRKLFMDLLDMFNLYLKKCVNENNEDLAKNTYLFLHTSYPDVGYDFGRQIMELGLGHKVLVTYTCENCRKFYIDYFQTEVTSCRNCGRMAAHMPNTSMGISTEGLAKLLNVSDLYIQYACAEGLALPVAEAKSCGIPAIALDHTAMKEQVEIEGCNSIKVQRLFYEACIETEQKRALPDNNDCVEKVYKFFMSKESDRKRWGEIARKDAAENYSFDRATKVIMDAIDSLEIHDRNKTWFNPTPNLAPLEKQLRHFRDNTDLVDWAIDNIIGKPQLKESFWRNDLIKSLNVGYIIHNGGRKDTFDGNKLIEMFHKLGQEHNFWEMARINTLVDKGMNKNIKKWELV